MENLPADPPARKETERLVCLSRSSSRLFSGRKQPANGEVLPRHALKPCVEDADAPSRYQPRSPPPETPTPLFAVLWLPAAMSTVVRFPRSRRVKI